MAAVHDSPSPPDPSGSRWGRRSRSSAGVPWLPVVVLAALLGGAAWWWFGYRDPEPPVEPVTPVAATPPTDEGTERRPPPPLDLPALDESDGVVRRVVATLSRHPRWAEWLVTDDLAVRFVSSVANVAAGMSPSAQVPFLQPAGDFQVRQSSGVTRIDPASYRRYDPLVEAFVSFDTDGAVDLYLQLLPLFEEAHQSLGFPEGTFGEAFRTAIDRVLAVQVPTQPPAVELDVKTYLLEDPALESLSPAEKHVLRLGPDNARAVQAKLRALRTRLVAEGVIPEG